MIVDANISELPELVADVCICGAGPAGISLARSLAANNTSVLLIEGGGLDYEEESQYLYQAYNTGQPYFDLEYTRLRFLGGSSNHWTGHCGTLEAQDFQKYDHHPLSGWPIKKSDLDIYTVAAREILDLPPDPPIVEPPQQSQYFKPFQIWESPPTIFSEKYIDELEQSKNIQLILNLNVVDIILDEDLRVVNRIVAATYDQQDRNVAISAKFFVLCMGGVENARMLLNANTQIESGIGNGSDNVGRYFSEHPHAIIGGAILNEDVASHFVSPTPKFMEKFKTLNFGLRVYTVDGLMPHNDFSRRADESVFKTVARSIACEVPFANDLVSAARGKEIDCDHAYLWIAPEQSLNPDSRVYLSDNVDRYGKHLPNVAWHFQELDWHTMDEAAIRYGEYMIKYNVGRVQIAEWLQNREFGENVKGGHHHMCTTRMSATPKDGVVDRDCRVHDVENLYLGGSSVFATGGHINPTFPIVQLTLRLGDHLASRLQRV